jgi:hypothetical protein
MSSNRSSLPDAHGLFVAERKFAGGPDGRCHRGRGASFGHGFELLRSYRRRGSAFASYGTFQTPLSTLNWANLGWDAGLDSATVWGSQGPVRASHEDHEGRNSRFTLRFGDCRLMISDGAKKTRPDESDCTVRLSPSAGKRCSSGS